MRRDADNNGAHNLHAFTSVEFHETLEMDLWVLGKILSLPSDPPTRVDRTDTGIRINVTENLSMPDQQGAVQDYRRNLLPAVFLMAQKVYSELFRVALGSSGEIAGGRQKDVEDKVISLYTCGRLVVSPPFSDRAEFLDWWSGRFDFKTLRDARNRVAHDKYQFADSELLVRKEDTILLQWREFDVLDFAQRVLAKSRGI